MDYKQQKILVRDRKTEIAKNILAYNGSGEIQIFYYNEKQEMIREDNFNNKITKINIFKTQMEEWFLNRAEELIENPDNDFIVLMICCAYIESIQQYKKGISSVDKSGRFFKESLKSICSDLTLTEENCNKIYSSMRCGIFHNIMINNNLTLKRIKTIENLDDNVYPDTEDNESNKCIIERDSILKIYPELLLKKIRNDFDTYVEDLKKDSSHYYENFEKRFVLQ